MDGGEHMAREFRLVPCPLCHAPILIVPGAPPGSGTNYTNRCVAHALTGRPGQSHHSSRGPDSVILPERTSSRLCGEPVTDPDGTIIPPYRTLTEYLALTQRPFDVAVLRSR
jgi:hypothetical protein